MGRLLGTIQLGQWAMAALLWLLWSCGESSRYSRRELFQLGRKYDPRLEILRPKKMGDWIRCFDYGRGCVNTLIMEYRGVTFICVRYEEAAQAIRFGRSIDAYIVKNWLLDDVSGEPVLEEFVQRAWRGKKAKSYPEPLRKPSSK